MVLAQGLNGFPEGTCTYHVPLLFLGGALCFAQRGDRKDKKVESEDAATCHMEGRRKACFCFS